MDITDLQRFLGHETITTTRVYAETTAATLQRRFDQLTDPTAHALVASIRQQQGDQARLGYGCDLARFGQASQHTGIAKKPSRA